MILNEQFIKEINDTEQFSTDIFEKTLNYTISYISKSDTSIRLGEILECDDDEAQPILDLFIRIVSYFAKFKAGEREFRANLEVLQISEERKSLLTTKLAASEKELRQKLSLLQNDTTPVYKNLRWRFDLQVASRTFEEELKPKILLQLELEDKNGAQIGHQILTDFANLKHLYEELSSALKAHESTSQKRLEKIFH